MASADKDIDIREESQLVVTEPDANLKDIILRKKEDIAKKVVDNIANPLDKWAVCAILESMGMRDKDAREEFGSRDLFELADDIFDLCKKIYQLKKQKEGRFYNRENNQKVFAAFLKYYGRGLSFLLPILGQVFLLFLFRFSLWAYIEFTEAQAVVVAIGTILSFLVAGGFIQATGREVLYYLNSSDYQLAQKAYFRLFRFNTAAVILVAILMLGFNFILPFLKGGMIIYCLLYFVLLAELWFSLSILYLIKHYFAVLILTLAGILPVYLVMEYTDWGMFIAHYTGLIFTNLISWSYSHIWFHHKIKRQEKKNLARLSRRSIFAYVTSPYFVYGFLYFGFLFLDRIISWSAYARDVPASIIWFRTPYELGMDWALLSLFLTIALLEFTIERFSRTLIPNQHQLTGFEVSRFNRIYGNFYKGQFTLLVIFGIASIFIAFYGVSFLKRFDYIPEVKDFFSNRITYFTFFVASAAYLVMSIGLLNGLFFLTLSRLNFAIRAILAGIIANIAVGLPLSRWFDYEYGVFGLLAGAVVFAMVSTRFIKKFFNKLDYFYYSAY